MVSMKDRIARAEARLDAPVDQRAINEAAEQFEERMCRLIGGMASEDCSLTLEDRLAKMSPAQHVAWCVCFVPGFQIDAATVEHFMTMHRDVRVRHPITQA